LEHSNAIKPGWSSSGLIRRTSAIAPLLHRWHWSVWLTPLSLRLSSLPVMDIDSDPRRGALVKACENQRAIGTRVQARTARIRYSKLSSVIRPSVVRPPSELWADRRTDPAHPDEARAQVLPLRHPARLDLPGAEGQPTPAHPRQNSPARKLRVGRARRWADAAGSNVGYRLGKQGGLADLTPEPGAGARDGAQEHRRQTRRLNVGRRCWLRQARGTHKNLAENNQSSCAAGSRRRLPSVARCSW
jgi:hypothetical protein